MATRPYTQHEISFSLTLREHLPSINGESIPHLRINTLALIDAEQLMRIKMVGEMASFNQRVFRCIFQPEPHALDELVIFKLEQLPQEGHAKICHLTLNILGADRPVPDTPIAVLFGDSSNPESAQLFFPDIEEKAKDSGEGPKSVRLLEMRDLPNSRIILDENEIRIYPKA